MNLTWHIVKRDLFRLRLPLLVWAVFVGSQVFVSNRLFSVLSADYTRFANTGMLLNLLVAIGLVICFIMAAFVVLDDPLVGSDMAWVTRPISGARLLCAKLLVAVLAFGLLPILIWIPWWLYCDFSAGQLATAAVRVLCLHALAVISGFTLASLVGQTGRFMLFSVLVVVAIWVAGLNFVTWEGFSSLSPNLLQTRLLLALGLMVICGATVVFRQYVTRRFVSSVVILAAGIIVAAAITLYWPWNLVNLRPENRKQMARSEAISAEIQEVRIAALANTTGPEDIGVSIKILFKDVPDDVSLSSGLADVELRWPDGEKITGSSLKMVSDYWSDRNEGPSVQKALGLPTDHNWVHHWDPETDAKHAEMIEAARQRMLKAGNLWHEPKRQPGAAWLTVTLPMTAEMATKVGANPPACSISAHILVKKPELLFEMPLKNDSWTTGGGSRLHLLNVSPQTWRGVDRAETKAFLTAVVSVSAPGLGGLSLYTVDRDHGTAVFQGRTTTFSVIPVAANIEGLYFTIGDPRLWRTDKWIEAPGWLEAARLAAVTYREVGGFDRELHTDRLTVKQGDND